MTLAQRFLKLVGDPPPAHLFEISPGGIAAARPGGTSPRIQFRPLPAGTLAVSPLTDNVIDTAAFGAAVAEVAGPSTGRKRRAALVLPDYCARIAVLDFDAFPSSAAEQLALVRFRMKKSLPFDVEGAAFSFYAQPKAGPKGKVEVVAAVVALEIVARYESPFRAAGIHPGLVTTSLVASLGLVEPSGVSVVAKLSGNLLAVAVLDQSTLRLARSVELETVDEAAIEGVLAPTLAFVEDDLGRAAERILLCGFEGRSAGISLPAEPLRSRFGVPGETNAGLLGLLEAAA